MHSRLKNATDWAGDLDLFVTKIVDGTATELYIVLDPVTWPVSTASPSFLEGEAEKRTTQDSAVGLSIVLLIP